MVLWGYYSVSFHNPKSNPSINEAPYTPFFFLFTKQFRHRADEFPYIRNPAVDYIQVSTNQAVERVAVFNLAGRQIKAFTYRAEEKYYVGDLPKGMYLIQLLGAQNSRIATRRISLR